MMELDSGRDAQGEQGGRPPLVVGLGASAGELQALQDFLRGVPEGSGAALVLLVHLDPSSPSLLPGLATAARLPVVEAEDGTRIEADRIYSVPCRTVVSLQDGILHLGPGDRPEDQRAAIDRFLYSLARDQGERAVAVILSGPGSDGALGLKAVSEAGGMTLVQDPATARLDAMPQSALATGAVDCVLAPGELAAELVAYARHLREATEGDGEQPLREQVEGALPSICEVLLQATGHNFRHYKNSTLVRRTLRRIQVLRLGSAREYLERLRADPAEIQQLFKDMLIGVTAFFRDPEAFEALARTAMPRIFEGRPPGEPVRIWVPGCATGEEAYTIAMLVREQLDRSSSAPEVQIFATDIDEQALLTARQGVYPLSIADELSPERLRRFFVKRGQNYHVAKEIRDLCLFSAHNLINDPPFSKLDLISCRNLLIYLGEHLQKKLIPLFHYALRPGGYLFLGPSEGISTHRELFRPVDVRHRISQRLPTAILPTGPVVEREVVPTSARPPNLQTFSDADTYLLMQRIILDEFAPKSVVVNEEGQITCASGSLEKYLTVSAGVFHNNVVRLAREGLRVGVRTALAEAVASCRRVVREGLSVRTEAGVQQILLTVQPMPQLGEECGVFLIVFQDIGPPLPRDELPRAADGHDAVVIIEQLERELETTRGNLEKTVQELEAANEDLKSSNEELLSMNEELQSANEELETSKEEVQQGNEALARANSDLENLLTSTQIATLFLDGAGNVRRVTPAVSAIYNVRPSDVGRPLDHFTHRARSMPLLPAAEIVRNARRPIEDEVETLEGTWYLRRVLPYRTAEGREEGIVITFTDVTERKRAEQALKEADRRKDEFLAILAHELRNPLAPIRNSVELLRAKGSALPEIDWARDIIGRQVEHLTRLVDDLLDVSRITRGVTELRKERVLLSTILDRALETSRPAIDARRHAIDVAVPPEPVHLDADTTRLAQVFSNLLANAAKYTPEGGRIRVIAEPQGRKVVVRVQDNGVGIPKGMQQRIFEMFMQVDTSLERAQGGLGIGLTIAKRLVEMHGGTIDVASDGAGHGCELIVRLPVAAGEDAPAEVAEEPAPGRVISLRALVADDNQDSAESLALLLEILGHRVWVVHDGPDALTAARELCPDIVVMDIGMPGMSGYDVARRMRELPELAGVVLVAMTGWGQDEDRRRSREAGFDHHLVKPVDDKKLRKIIADLSTRVTEPR